MLRTLEAIAAVVLVGAQRHPHPHRMKPFEIYVEHENASQKELQENGLLRRVHLQLLRPGEHRHAHAGVDKQQDPLQPL